MKRRQLSILSNAAKIFSLLSTCALAQTSPVPASDTVAAREIARHDLDFSALSVEKGMPAACIAYFAEDGVAFAPRAVNGKKYWGAQKEFSGTLVWTPVFAAAARAGDLGFTTGPWELKKAGQVGAFGNYVTIWQKKGGDEWKIVLDVGVDNSQPAEPPPVLQVLPSDGTVGRREDARRNYRRTQLTFAERARKDIGQALIESAAPDVRVLRDKSLPAIGIDGARIILGSEHGKVVQTENETRLSSSSDFAYTYGNYSEERGNLTEHGIYLMIWQVDLNGDWKLALDLRKQIPERPQ